jgi:hypothetical protein
VPQIAAFELPVAQIQPGEVDLGKLAIAQMGRAAARGKGFDIRPLQGLLEDGWSVHRTGLAGCAAQANSHRQKGRDCSRPFAFTSGARRGRNRQIRTLSEA